MKKSLTKNSIHEVVWQIINHCYDDYNDIDNNTCLNNFDADPSEFQEYVIEIFGIEVDPYKNTIGEIIEFLDTNKDKIKLSKKVNDKLKINWRNFHSWENF